MENKNSLVSIIVPVYGTEAYLPMCIESILAQSYSNIQLILVDDQSPDRCPEISNEYAEKDSRILVVHQENKGVSGARNTGLRYVNGDYVMFVDSDDELFTEAVEVFLSDARKYDADIVSATIKTVNNGSELCNLTNDDSCSLLQGDEPLLLLLDEDFSTHSACSKLFRYDFVKDIQFEEGKHMGEDGFFMFMCYINNPRPRLVQHNIDLYKQNVRPGSSSRLKFSDRYLSMLYFFEEKKKYITSNLPQYVDKIPQMEVCVCLRLLDALCGTKEKKFRDLRRQSIKTVCKLHRYYRPINEHHKKLVWIVSHRLYFIYRAYVYIKYYRLHIE